MADLVAPASATWPPWVKRLEIEVDRRTGAALVATLSVRQFG